MAQVKERGGGREERKEEVGGGGEERKEELGGVGKKGRKRLQTNPGILKTTHLAFDA